MTDEDLAAWEEYANVRYWNRSDPGKDHSREQAAKELWGVVCAYKDKRIAELEDENARLMEYDPRTVFTTDGPIKSEGGADEACPSCGAFDRDMWEPRPDLCPDKWHKAEGDADTNP